MKTEADKHEEFEIAVGGNQKAFELLHIWNNSHPVGTKYDELIDNGRYKSKTQMFIRTAKRRGYTESQIDMFLNLQ